MSDDKPTAKQWVILRRLADGPMSQGDLCQLTGRRPQAIAKSLPLMASRGWVEALGERGHAARNKPARRWALSEVGRELEAGGPSSRAAEAASTLALRPHQGFVTTTLASREVPQLMELLADGQLAAEASAIARLDGEQHAFLFLFDPSLGAGPSEALSAALKAHEFAYTAGTVADVRRWEEFLSDARASRTAGVTRDHRTTFAGGTQVGPLTDPTGRQS